MTPYLKRLRAIYEGDAVTVVHGQRLTCNECGQEMGKFHDDRHRNTRKFCSAKCKQKSYRDRRRNDPCILGG